MMLPILTLTWPDDVRIQYDANTNTWSSEDDEPIVSDAYIALMQLSTHDLLLQTAYTPYPFLQRIEELADTMEFTLDGIADLYAALNARIEDRLAGSSPVVF